MVVPRIDDVTHSIFDIGDGGIGFALFSLPLDHFVAEKLGKEGVPVGQPVGVVDGSGFVGQDVCHWCRDKLFGVRFGEIIELDGLGDVELGCPKWAFSDPF